MGSRHNRVLRYIACICLCNNNYYGSEICIIIGPDIGIAIKLIKRTKSLSEVAHEITFSSRDNFGTTY
jgi:hypothetical protein